MIVEIDSIHGALPASLNQPVMVFYRVTDDDGGVHNYGPVTTHDPDFNPEDFAKFLPAKIECALIENEAQRQKQAIEKAAIDAVKPQLVAIDSATASAIDAVKVESVEEKA